MGEFTVGKSTFYTSISPATQNENPVNGLLQATKSMASLIDGSPLPKEARFHLEPESMQQLKATKILNLDASGKDSNLLKTLVEDAALANFPYHRDQSQLSTHAPKWSATNYGFTNDSGFEIDKRFDNGILTKSGLTAYIFTNHETKEVRLVFGGTTSGSSTGNLFARNAKNPVTTLKQWVTNALNAFSKEPKSFREAAGLAESVYKNIQTIDKVKDYSFSVSGHSKGGGEASYAAMMLGAKTDKPIKSINFSSAQLGKKLIDNVVDKIAKNCNGDLSDDAVIEKFKNLSSKIAHVKVKGDPVPAMHKFGFNIMHVGQTFTVDSKKGTYDPVAKHDQFFDQIRSWVNPSEEKSKDNVQLTSYKPIRV
jgi:uncharacterized membrane protein YgcG